MAKEETVFLSENPPSAKRRSLTAYISRHCPKCDELNSVLSGQGAFCHRLGQLPPALRAQVKREDLSRVTAEFVTILTPFLEKKMSEFRNPMTITYSLTALNDLFNTPCQLSLRGEGPFSEAWMGSFGCVIKMTLPKLKQAYALKVFYAGSDKFSRHGPKSEIVTAFAANKAEPKYNHPVYLAYWGNISYMLSQWAGDDPDGCPIRSSKNEIFLTKPVECVPRNFRQGKRIDFGETLKTIYGVEPYHVRKLYRQIVNICQRKDSQSFRKIYSLENIKSENLKRATNLVNSLLPYKDIIAFDTFQRMNLMASLWRKKMVYQNNMDLGR